MLVSSGPLLLRAVVVAMNMTQLLTNPRLLLLLKLWQLILLAVDVPGTFPGVPISSSWHIQNAANSNPSSLTTPSWGVRQFLSSLHCAKPRKSLSRTQWQRQGDSTGHISQCHHGKTQSNIWEGREKNVVIFSAVAFFPQKSKRLWPGAYLSVFQAGRVYYWCLSVHLNICTPLSFGQHLASPWFVPASFCVHLPCSGDRLSEIMRVWTHF